MSETRPPELSPADHRAIARELRHQGGSVTIKDDGLSKVQTWVNLSIGSAILTGMAWVIISVNELKVAVTVSARENSYLKEQLQDLRSDFRDHVKGTVRTPPDIQEKR